MQMVSSRIKKSFWGLKLQVVVIGLILLGHGYSRSIYDLICVPESGCLFIRYLLLYVVDMLLLVRI